MSNVKLLIWNCECIVESVYFIIESFLIFNQYSMANCYYGDETKKSIDNFPITRLTVDYRVIKAIAEVKKATAVSHYKLGDLDEDIYKAICQAADEVISGELNEQFVTTVIQGGAGTSINMNVNEVIANRGSEILGKDFGYIHPLDHVNKKQSTNDAVPTAIKISTLRLLEDCKSELKLLADSFLAKSKEFKDVIKVGRTHLQDAVPISLGREFRAYSSCLYRCTDNIRDLLDKNSSLRMCNLGGTSIGTGINSSKKFVDLVHKELSNISGLDLMAADDLVDATQNIDIFVKVSGILKTAGVALNKIASDLRLMASGPRAGLGEINLPEVQKGSSIMPGKVNPVMAELVNQVSYQILGNDATISEAASQGQFELNVMEPVLIFNLIQSMSMLRNVLEVFRLKCVDGITANKERCKFLVENSLCTVTALNEMIGYDKATQVAKKAVKEGKTVREAVLELGFLTEDVLDDILDPKKLAGIL